MLKSPNRPLWERLRNPNCELCLLHKTAKTVCLIGDGPYPADLMLVGEAPGDREDSPNIRKPFQGRSGHLLDSLLETLGLQRSKIYISNAVHCRPPENDKPSISQIRICSDAYLSKEVQFVKPKLIIALGQIAAQGLLGEKVAVGSARNRVWKERFRDTPTIVTYHPAAALRNDYLVEPLVKDFEWALEVLNGKDKKEELKYIQIQSVKEIPDLHQAKWLSLDLETEGFDPFLPNRSIISCQLSIKPRQAYYLRWNPKVAAEVKELAEQRTLNKTGHNINKFDRNWLRAAGIKLRGRVHDTLIGIHLLDENFPDKSLDVVASEFTDLKSHKDELKQFKRRNKHLEFKDYPLDIMIPYGCGDADASLRLKDVQIPKLKEQNLMPLFNMQMQAMRMFADVEWGGAKIDVKLIDELSDKYEERIINLDRLLKGVNSKSAKQVAGILYKDWKLPAVGLPTKKSKWKPVANTAEKTLLKLLELGLDKEQELFILRILRSRELRTQLSTYLLGLGDYIRPGNFIHPNFLLHGTDTGRYSCRNPNLQNIPREGEIKRLFISRYGSEGIILSIDVSQGELRIAAHRSGEPTLLAAFRSSGHDIHTETAARVLGIPPERVTKQQRKAAKTVNFGILYGGGVSKMAYEMKTSEQEAAKFIRAWKNTFSEWEPYVRQVHKEVLRRGYVVSDFGRRRRLSINDPESEFGKEALRQAVNAPIQGGLHDYTVLCGLELRKRLKEEHIQRVHFFTETHDSWSIDTLQENVSKIIPLAVDVFKNPDTSAFGFEFKVPMDIEISGGPNWLDQTVLYPVKEKVNA